MDFLENRDMWWNLAWFYYWFVDTFVRSLTFKLLQIKLRRFGRFAFLWCEVNLVSRFLLLLWLKARLFGNHIVFNFVYQVWYHFHSIRVLWHLLYIFDFLNVHSVSIVFFVFERILYFLEFSSAVCNLLRVVWHFLWFILFW